MVGGCSDAALARAARWADAWLAIWMDGTRLARARDQLAEEATNNGRGMPRTLVTVFVHVSSDANVGREHVAAFMQGQYGVPLAQVER